MESLDDFANQSADLQLLEDLLLGELRVDDFVKFEILLGPALVLTLIDTMHSR